MSMNGARVVGPALGGWLTSRFGFAEVFSFNAATYLFVLAAIAFTQIPPASAEPRNLGDRLFGGFKIVTKAPQVRNTLNMYPQSINIANHDLQLLTPLYIKIYILLESQISI